MFKIAYCAGHFLGTKGKRVPAKLDPAETREWVLNDRVARYFNERMLQYDGVETMRVDDSTGKKEIEIKDRTAAANEWGADIYLDIHHNAAGRIFDGGGVVAYSYPGSKKGKEYRDAVYDAVIKAGKLRGNRSNPKCEKVYKSLKLAHAPAILIEYGFMDSRSDYPVISTEEYAKAVGYATADAIAKVAGLKKKEASEPKILYRVQVGCYSKKSNAETVLKALKNDGYDAIIKEEIVE
jgi:N-acetylmuramoyl-L-alanine amidase